MITKWVLEAIESFFLNLIEQAINLFLGFIASINGMASQVLDLPVVVSGITYSQILAGSILATKIAYEAWYNYVLRDNGDPDADPGGLLLRSVHAVFIISAVPWLVRWMYKFGTTIASDVAKLPGIGIEETPDKLSLYMGTVITSGAGILYLAAAVIFALVLLVVIFIQTFIRAAELAVAAVAGSFMALGLSNQHSEIFSSWWRNLINLSMAQAIQLFLMKVSFFALTDFDFGGVPLFNLFLFIGFLWVTYKSPSMIKEFIFSTGTGKAAGSVGTMVIMRRMMRR